MSYAAVVSVDNHREDPDAGRRGLRDELAPAMKQFPGFESGLFCRPLGPGLGALSPPREPGRVRSPHLGAHEVVDAGSRRPPFRRAGTGDNQPPHAGAVRPEGFEQLQHARVVGPRFSRQCERDVMGQMPVAGRNRIRVAGDEMGDVGRGPGSDAVHRARTGDRVSRGRPRRPGRAGQPRGLRAARSPSAGPRPRGRATPSPGASPTLRPAAERAARGCVPDHRARRFLASAPVPAMTAALRAK